MTGGIIGQGPTTYENTIANITAHHGIPSGGVFTPPTYSGGTSTPQAAQPPATGVAAVGEASTAASSTPRVSQSSTAALSASAAAEAGFGVRSLSTQPGGIYLVRGSNYYNEYGNLIGNSRTGIVTSNAQGISAIQNALSSEPAGYGITFSGSVINAQGIPVGNTLTNTPYKGSGISEASLTPPIGFATFGKNANIQWSSSNPFSFTLTENIPGYAQEFEFTGTIAGKGIGASTIYATDSAVNQAWEAVTSGAPLWGQNGIVGSYSQQPGLQSLPISFNLQTGEISSSGSIIGEIGTYGTAKTPLYGNVEATSLNYNYNLGNVISGNGQPQPYVTNTSALTQSQAQSLLTNAAFFFSYQPGNYIYSGPSGYNQIQASGSAGYATLQGLAGEGNTIVGYTSTPFIAGNYVASTNSSATPQYVSLETFATAPSGTTFSQTTTTQAPAAAASQQLSGNLSPSGVANALVVGVESPLRLLFGSSNAQSVNTTALREPSVIGSYSNTLPLSSSAISYIAMQEGLPMTLQTSTRANSQSVTPYSYHGLQPNSYQISSNNRVSLSMESLSPLSLWQEVYGYTASQIRNPQSPYSVIQAAVDQANAAPAKTPAQEVLKETGITGASQDVLLALAFWSPATKAAASAVPVLGGQATGLISNAQVINSPTASLETKGFAFAGMLGTGFYDAVTAYYVTLGAGSVIDLATGSALGGASAGLGAATRTAIAAASASPEEYATNLAAYATEQAAGNAAYGSLGLGAKAANAAIGISNFVNSYALAGYATSYGQVATGTYAPTYTSNVGQDIFIRETISGLENAAFATAVTLGAAGLSAGWSALHPEPVSAANGGVLQGGESSPRMTIIENNPQEVGTRISGGYMFKSDVGIQTAHVSGNPLQQMIDQGQVIMGVREGADNAFTAVMRDSEMRMGLYGNQVLMSEPTASVSDLPAYLRNKPAAYNFAAKVANLNAAGQASDLLGQSSVSLSGVKAVQLPLYGEYEVPVSVTYSASYAEQPAIKGNWLSQQLENWRVSLLGSRTTELYTTQGTATMFASAKGDMEIGLATEGLGSEWTREFSTTNPIRSFLGLEARSYTMPPITTTPLKGLFYTVATDNPDSLTFFANSPGGVASLIGHVEGTGVAYENGMVVYTGEGLKLGMTDEGAPIRQQLTILASNAQKVDRTDMLDAYYSPKSPFAWTAPSGRSADLGLDQIGNGGAFTPLSRENPEVTRLGVEPIYGTSAGESAPTTSVITSEAAPSINSAGRYLGTSGGTGLNDVSTAEYNGPAGTSVQISNQMHTMAEPAPSQVQSAAAGAIASQAAQVARQSQLEASLFANPPIPSLIDPAALASPHAITNINATSGLSIASFNPSVAPKKTTGPLVPPSSTTAASTLTTATLGTLLNQENQQLVELQTIASLGYQQFEQQTLRYTDQFTASLGYMGAYAQYQALTAPLQKEVSAIDATISSLLGTTSTLSLNPSSVSPSYLQSAEYQIAGDIQNIFNLEAGLGLTVLAGESPMAAELGSSLSGITISGVMNELEPAQKIRKQSASPLSSIQGTRDSFLPGAARNIRELNRLRSNQTVNRIGGISERAKAGERGRERLRDEYDYRERLGINPDMRYGEVYAPASAFASINAQRSAEISPTRTTERNTTATAVTPAPPSPAPPAPPPILPVAPQSPNNYESNAVKGNGILNYTPESEYHPSATTQLLPDLEPEFEKEFVPALSGVLVRPLKEPASLKAKIKNPSP